MKPRSEGESWLHNIRNKLKGKNNVSSATNTQRNGISPQRATNEWAVSPNDFIAQPVDKFGAVPFGAPARNINRETNPELFQRIEAASNAEIPPEWHVYPSNLIVQGIDLDKRFLATWDTDQPATGEWYFGDDGIHIFQRSISIQKSREETTFRSCAYFADGGILTLILTTDSVRNYVSVDQEFHANRIDASYYLPSDMHPTELIRPGERQLAEAQYHAGNLHTLMLGRVFMAMPDRIITSPDISLVSVDESKPPQKADDFQPTLPNSEQSPVGDYDISILLVNDKPGVCRAFIINEDIDRIVYSLKWTVQDGILSAELEDHENNQIKKIYAGMHIDDEKIIQDMNVDTMRDVESGELDSPWLYVRGKIPVRFNYVLPHVDDKFVNI